MGCSTAYYLIRNNPELKVVVIEMDSIYAKARPLNIQPRTPPGKSPPYRNRPRLTRGQVFIFHIAIIFSIKNKAIWNMKT